MNKTAQHRRARRTPPFSKLATRFTVALVAAILCLSGVRSSQKASSTPPSQPTSAESPRSLHGEQAIDHLKQQGTFNSLQEAMAGARYAPQWVANTGIAGMEGAFEMKNSANHLRAYVSASEMRVLQMTDEAQQSWQLGMKLASCGSGDNPSAVGAGEVKAAGNRVEIRRSAKGNPESSIVEWYENSARGIEQGFDIAARPEFGIGNPQSKGEPLRLTFEVSGRLEAQLDETRQQVGFTDGRTVLVYEKLAAWDAKGQRLDSHMEVEKGRLSLVVEDEGAEYQLRIDPLLREQIRITASDGATDDSFGNSVAISGDTAVVGAVLDNIGVSDIGSAYVFVRSGATWTQQTKLTASDGSVFDEFGRSVAISGDTVVVGAARDNVGFSDQGSAYVFVRSGTAWAQQAQLFAPDGEAFDQFGRSVAISGDTVVVGVEFDDVGTGIDQGSAYVYVRSALSWTQQAKLTAADGAEIEFFGASVAISGDTVVVGAYNDVVGATSGQGSAFVFVRSGASWMQQAKLTAADGETNDNFGFSVAISGNTVVVGAYLDDVDFVEQGSAYVYVRSGVSWTQQQQLMAADGATNDLFGESVSISGDTVVVGCYLDNVGFSDQGSAYVFMRSGVSWTQQQQLAAADGAANDAFGSSVAISGDTVVVGASLDDAPNSNQGSAYIYICNWNQQQQLTASDGAADDRFGESVAISGDTVVVGASVDDIGGNSNQGSAYVFVHSATTWTQQAQLTASDGAAFDFFGHSVAISGETVVVGALGDNTALNDQGSTYVFVRSGTTWTQQAQLIASDGAANDLFGQSVAISGETVVVGAVFDDVGATNQGSAYVFVRTGATWTQQAQLIASDGAASDNFGQSIAVSGDTVVVGAFLDNVGFTDQGSAYVFIRSGTTWTQQTQLTASDGAVSDQFGIAVAISGNTVVVGAFLDDVGANSAQGTAYVFVRSGMIWSQQAQLTASDGVASDRFAASVAISGDTLVVGAVLDDVGANGDQGSAYVFVRSGVGWTERQKLTASDGLASDEFGTSVAMSGDTVVVGATFDDVGANANQGSAYIFFTGCNTSPTLAAGNQICQKGSAATSATIATVDDGQDPIGYLTVSVVSAPTGISITGVTNSNGVISAQVAALCNATLGNNSVLLRVQDSDGATGDVTLYVNVTANAAPTLGIYPNTAVSVLGSTTVTPNLTPSDNGNIVTLSATSPTFTGILSIDLDTGIVSISNARPGGTHVVTVTAVDNCGVATTSGFTFTVNCQSITVNPSSIPGATAGSAYTQVFTQTLGNAPVGFSLSGTLPTGMSFIPGTATLSGTPTQVGGFPITVTATDTNNCSGSRNYTLVVGAMMLVWNGNTSSNWNTASNWTPSAVPTTFNDVLIPTAGVTNQPTISAASSSINAMTIQSSRVLTINSSLQLSTAADVTSVGTITGAGTLAFGGATFTQNGSVSVASAEFTAGTHALTGGGTFASGIVTALSGAAVTLTSSHSISVLVINSGGLFDATNQILTLTGAGTAIFNSGSFTATGSTLVYQGSVAQVVTSNISYSGLTINNAAGVSLAGDTTVNGLLNLATDLTTGSFTLTMPAGGTSTGTSDVIGNVKRTGFTNGAALSFGNPLNTIRFDSGTPPSDVTVNLVKSTPAGFPANNVSRTYTIAPNGGSSISATLRLRYKDTELNGLSESTLELWRFNGSSWVSPAGAATRDTTQNFVEETGITAFSPWAIGGPSGPTEVKLISFEATGYENGVMLEWKTGFEVDNLGFGIYRQEGSTRTLLNQEIVAGSALLAGSGTALTAGRAYAFWVGAKDAGSDSAFWLEDIDLKGNSTWHGPFATKHLGGTPPVRSNASFLGKLGSSPSQADSTRVVEAAASLTAGSSAQASIQSSLASHAAVKIAVKREGWYRVTQPELLAAGLNPKLDPRFLQLFVDGRELPIYVSKGKGGAFDESSAIEFYGVGLDTPSTDSRTYWLIAGATEGKRIAQTRSVGTPSPAQSFTQTVERRDRTIYFAALLNGEKENFFGAVIAGAGVDQTLALTHLAQFDTSNFETTLELALQGVTVTSHRVLVQLNGVGVREISFNRQEQGVSKFNINHSLLREGENTVRLIPQNGASDISLVDHIRISYQHSFTADDNVLKLTAAGRQQVTIDGFTLKAIRVFDVTNPESVQELIGEVVATKSGSSITVTPRENGQRVLLAIDEEQQSKRAASVRLNQESSLRSSANAADFVIMTSRDFLTGVESLRVAREAEGYRVAVIDAEDIYDEFSFGNKSPQSIKDFLAYAVSNWKLAPRFVLFAGDASVDARNYLGFGDNDFIPTRLIDTSYLETASDDWFADFNNDGVAEMAVGRLPMRTAEEATRVIAKIQRYELSKPSQSALLVSDMNDGYNFEQASTQLRLVIPTAVNVEEIRRGQLDPATAKTRLLDAINRGPKIVNYYGHGSMSVWNGSLLSPSDAAGLKNEDHLSMFVMMTCLNGYFHDAALDSLAEALLAEPGGAVAVWASSGMTLPSDQAVLNQQFYRLLFSQAKTKGNPLTIGEAAMKAKAAITDIDVRTTWTFFGDPTMRLK